MKKEAWFVACALLLCVSAAGFAQTAPLTNEALAMILGQPAVKGACATQSSRVLFAAKGPGDGPGGVGQMSACTAQASCGSGVTPVSCSGNSTCSAIDRNCPSQRGQVTCDGVTKTCAVCPVDYCAQCASTGDCVACCRCDGGTAIMCNNCCTCDATGDCMACCRCGGGTLSQCSRQCGI